MDRTRKQLALLVLLAALLPTGTQAATPPDGIEAGKWVLTPFWQTELEYNDNIFQQEEATSDTIHSVILGVAATMPIKNSIFELRYDATQRKYNKTGFPRDLEQEGQARLQLRSRLGDRMTISDTYTRGVTNQLENLEGEPVFNGVPYDYNVAEIELARDNPRMHGYSLKLRRADHSVAEQAILEDDDAQIYLYDYRGYESSFEYRYPVPLDNWLIAYSDFRYFKHFEPGINAGYFRSERSGSYQLGMRGHIGGRHAFSFRTGYGHFRYGGPLSFGSDFNGLVGRANFRFVLGERTDLDVSMERRPLPSFYKTYYIINVLRLRIDRLWQRGSSVGFNVFVSRNQYGEPLPDRNPPWVEPTLPLPWTEPDCGGARRIDRRLMLEGHVQWMIHDLAGVRLSASQWRRDSNCFDLELSSNVISAGIVLGWE